MEKQNREQVLKVLFAQHQGEAGFHMTSDNQAFTDKHKSDGLNHAKTLDDKTLVWCKNPKVSEDDTIDEDNRDSLIARYKELFGKEPAKNIGNETLKNKIADKEADLELESLTAKYKELFGAEPEKDIEIEALRKQIEEKEAELK